MSLEQAEEALAMFRAMADEGKGRGAHHPRH